MPNQSTETLPRARRSAKARRSAQLIQLLDCERPLAPSTRHTLGEIDQVAIGRAPERSCSRVVAGGVRRLELGLPDRWTSREHARLLRENGRWLLEDARSKNCTVVNGRVVRRALLDDGDLIEVGHTIFLFAEGSGELPGPPDLVASELGAPAPGLETFVAPLAALFAGLARAARSAVPIVILGETGTGKEVVARAAHALSARDPFVGINCGALPEALLQSELFGHRRGAFSGAVEDRRGLVRAADGGTLFLDEIGDLPPACQVAILRTLQEREVLPLGETRPIKVDVRFVCATHQPLGSMVESGSFRRDLLARLSGFTVELPPLRERREDLGLLIAALLGRDRSGRRATFSPEAARMLLDHPWPLNVRELERCLATAVALADGELIEPSHLPASIAREAPDLPEEQGRLREELVTLMNEHAGNVAAVARALRKGRTQIHRWLVRYGLQPESFRR